MIRTRPLEGALLAFDPDTGVSVRVRRPSTRELRAGAPRAVQIAVTNHCNLACGFCYRDQSSDSAWTVDSLSTLLFDLDRAGVVEVTFGGGEPFAFKGFDELLQRLRATGLAVSVTTNGALVDAAMLRRIEGSYAELRLSLYDDPPHQPIVDRFVAAGARFGVNLLVTPQRLPMLTGIVLDLVSRGVRDVLLLSYNGDDDSLHLSAAEERVLEASVRALHDALGDRCALKLSVCFGDRLAGVPRLFADRDCGAGTDFVAIGSDRTVHACSFHHDAVRIDSAEDVLAFHRDRARNQRAAQVRGCARSRLHGPERLLRRAPPQPAIEATEIHVFRAYASNNSGSYTLVGSVPSLEVARSTVEEILAISAEHSAWLRKHEDERWTTTSVSPLDAFIARLGLTAGTDVGRDESWPDGGEVRAIAIGQQILLHVGCTITMPPLFGELIYKRGGRVAAEWDHAHHPMIVDGTVWVAGMWQKKERAAVDAKFAAIEAELRALLPTLARKVRHDGEARVEPAWHPPESGLGLAFATIFADLVGGVAAVSDCVERHGGTLHVRIAEPPIPAADPLEAWRRRGRGQGRHQVVLWRLGEDRVEIMKVLRDRLAIGLDEVKTRLASLPWIAADGLTIEDARALAEALRDTGSDATIALL